VCALNSLLLSLHQEIPGEQERVLWGSAERGSECNRPTDGH